MDRAGRRFFAVHSYLRCIAHRAKHRAGHIAARSAGVYSAAALGVRRTDKSTYPGHFSSSVALHGGRPAPLRNGDADAGESSIARRRNRCRCVMIPTRASCADNNLITTETSSDGPATSVRLRRTQLDCNYVKENRG